MKLKSLQYPDLGWARVARSLLVNNNNTYLYGALFTLFSNALLKKHSYNLTKYTNVIDLILKKMKVFKSFLNIVMESALWIFRGSSFHNLAAEVPETLWIYFYMAQVM